MLLAGIFPLLLGMLLSYIQSNKSLRDVIGSNFHTVAKETANKIDFVIEKELAKNRQTTLHPNIINWVEKQNALSEGDSLTRIEADFASASAAWKKKKIQSLIENSGTKELLSSLTEPSHSSASTLAFYITNTRGLLVATINDYPPLVSHEDDIGKKVVKEGVYLSNVFLNKKLNEYVFDLVMPIFGQSAKAESKSQTVNGLTGPVGLGNHEKPLIGMLHRVYEAKKYFSAPLETVRFGDTGHAMIIDNNGVVIDCPILPTGFQIPHKQVVQEVTLPEAGWVRTFDNGHGSREEAIIGFSPLSEINSLLAKSAEAPVHWHMFVWQASEELFAPTRKLLVWNTAAAVFGVFLIALIGTYAADRIIKPIRKLQKALGRIGIGSPWGTNSELARGAEDQCRFQDVSEIEVHAEDEIGELTSAFNKMSRDLRATRESELRYLDETEQLLITLAEREARINAVMNNVVDGIITIDEYGIIESFNLSAERIFGYKADEVKGKHVQVLMPEPDRSRHDEYMQNYMRTGIAKMIGMMSREVTAQRKDGYTFSLELEISEMWFGQRRLFVGVMRDITQRKGMEADLRKLSRAVEQSPSSVMITDRQGFIEYVNPNFLHTLGYTYEEVIGKKPNILKSGVHPPHFYKKLWETILSGKEWRGEFCNRKKNGELIWELQSISPIREAEGKITHFLSVKIDDTERKRAEMQLKLYASELERSNDSLKDFAAIASHDLQEPLRKVVSFGDRLFKEFGESLDERGRDYLERMQGAAQRMKSFIYDLLEYSKVASKPRALKQVNLKLVIDEVLVDLEASIKQTQGRVIFSDMPTLEADPLLMRQLFQNLIGNALKFHKPDIPPVVKIYCRYTNKGFWEICVEDNGIGFDMKYHDRIFKPFQRLHGRTRYEGSGMGLAICQKIVAVHSGIFSAKSEPQVGSKFIVRLPEKQRVKEISPF